MAATLGVSSNVGDVTRLTARIKQVQRFDWPASLKDDPDVRRGYTLEQCLKLAFSMLLQDAFVPTTPAIRMAIENHGLFLSVVANFLEADCRVPFGKRRRRSDSLYFVSVQGGMDSLGRLDPDVRDTGRLRVVRHDEIAELWIGSTEFPRAGGRTIIDMPGALSSIFQYVTEHELLTPVALSKFAYLARQTAVGSGYERVTSRIADRYRY